MYNLHEKPILHYLILLLVAATLIVSIFGIINTYQLRQDIDQIKKVVTQRSIDATDLLQKLTSHNETKKYEGISPINIIAVTNNNLANLQTQINGLNESYIGNFLVQYPDVVIVYDYNKDIISGVINLQRPQAKLPDDFFTKLNKHPQLKGLRDQQPEGGQLDESSLTSLNKQFPDFYLNASVGDFLLRYKTKLIIYDYDKDKIINSVDLKDNQN